MYILLLETIVKALLAFSHSRTALLMIWEQ